MASSLITKKRIAKAFRDLLATREFDKISIVDIMESAGIRRQTFYNHFLDKYELLDWIFETDLTEYITNNLDFISGQKLLQELFFYFEQERDFYIQLFDIQGQNNFYDHFISYCRLLVSKILREYGQIDSDSSAYTCFLLDYHSHALASIIVYTSLSDLLSFMIFIKRKTIEKYKKISFLGRIWGEVLSVNIAFHLIHLQ